MILTVYVCPEHGQRNVEPYGDCGMGVVFCGVRACDRELLKVRIEFELPAEDPPSVVENPPA